MLDPVSKSGAWPLVGFQFAKLAFFYVIEAPFEHHNSTFYLILILTVENVVKKA